MERRAETLRVLLLSVASACAYGVLHDQVTARVSIEYFTVAHPRIFPTESPTWLALGWGIVATLGVGLGLGAVLAMIASSGGRPALPARALVRPVLILLGVTALAALTAGALGYFLAERRIISLPRQFAEALAHGRRSRFLAVWCAHGAAYAVGILGGALLCHRVWKARGCPRVLSFYPRTRWEILRAILIAALAAGILALRCVAS
jgi:hypothetical protein